MIAILTIVIISRIEERNQPLLPSYLRIVNESRLGSYYLRLPNCSYRSVLGSASASYPQSTTDSVHLFLFLLDLLEITPSVNYLQLLTHPI